MTLLGIHVLVTMTLQLTLLGCLRHEQLDPILSRTVTRQWVNGSDDSAIGRLGALPHGTYERKLVLNADDQYWPITWDDSLSHSIGWRFVGLAFILDKLYA